MKTTIIGAGFAVILGGAALGCSVDATGNEAFELEQAVHADEGNHWGNQDFLIQSPNFDDGAALPPQYTCEGNAFGSGISPELNWTQGPPTTQSYAIIFADQSLLPEQPRFAYHWAIWNIPQEVHNLPEGIESEQFPESMKGAEQAKSGGQGEFFGPCPSWQNYCSGGATPRSDDSYTFTIYALPDRVIEVPAHEDGNYVARLEAIFDDLALTKTVVNATSDASPTSAPFCNPTPPAE